MGTTLTAIVEWREPDQPHPGWWRFGTLKLGKDSAAMARLDGIASRDWPLDVHDRYAPSNDFHRYWATGSQVIELPLDVSPMSRALGALLVALDAEGYQTRVLFLEI